MVGAYKALNSVLIQEYSGDLSELGGIPNLYRLVSAILECKSVTKKNQSMQGSPSLTEIWG